VEQKDWKMLMSGDADIRRFNPQKLVRNIAATLVVDIQ
jgi:hypothetical protein